MYKRITCMHPQHGSGAKKRSGDKSGLLEHLFESQKVSEDRIKERANIEKLELAEITLQRTRRSEIVYVRLLDDAARGTPEDPDAVRNRVDATQVNAYDSEDVVQATLAIKASRIILSPAATKPNVKYQHYSSGVGWRRMKAWYGQRETNKRCGRVVKGILMGESVVDVPTTIASENHGYVTVRRGADTLSSGCAPALGEVERVRMAQQHKVHATHRTDGVWWREMIEGHHSYRRRRSPRKSEWESNSKQVDDMTELSRRKLDSKRTPTPVTKATGKGRRDIDDELDQHDVRASREVAGTGASSTGASSIQFVTFVVHPGETWVFNCQADPKTLYTVRVFGHGRGSGKADREVCAVCGEVRTSHPRL